MGDIRARTSVWKGLNRMPYIVDGEMRNMKNLCSDAYPYLTTRKGRTPYKFDIYIPAPEGETYRDIERLPEPCAEEMENVYKLTESYDAEEYVSGKYYYYDAATATWVQGMKDAKYLGQTSSVFHREERGGLYSDLYKTHYFKDANYIYGINSSPTYRNQYENNKIKYIGEDAEGFKRGKTYVYKLYVEAYWTPGEGSGSRIGDKYTFNENMQPGATEGYANSDNYFYYGSEITTDKFPVGNSYYVCRLRGYGCWEECNDAYEIVEQVPQNPVNGKQIRYINTTYSGAPVETASYKCTSDVTPEGKTIIFYEKDYSEYGESVTFLPAAAEDKIGSVYYYSGVTTAGQFAKCSYQNGEYQWVKVSHPKVKRTVTIAEHIEQYEGIKIKQIIEIAAFKGKIAAVFMTQEGRYKLYYDKSIWDLNNVTKEPGKKLSIVGNRLIVGESGSYLHIKDGEKTFTKTSSAIAESITAGYALYGNGQDKSKYSYAFGSAESGEATFVFYAQGGSGYGYKEVYEALNVKGTGFSVTFNGNTYYLTSASVTYQPNYNIYAWLAGSWHYDYADILTIKASGVKEDFDWELTKHAPIDFTFKTTDAHYEDVVAWKKRLWGYSENTLYGTRSDIFGEYGKVDWLLGDNTYLESIAQPIWQGGDITGLAALSNALILLKEDSLTVFTGNYPAIMSGSTIPCRGLNAENRESVAVGNETVFYLSQDGVYRFTGGIPQCISRDIKIKGTEAVGASDGNKYWLSLKEEDGNYALYVHDANLGIWHKEDNTRVSSFTMLGGEMYMVDADTNEVYNINASQEDVEWELELWFDEGTHKKKKYKEFIFRGNVGECELQLKADDGDWQSVRWTEDKLRVRIEPFICEELGIKLKGKGICEIKTLDRVYEEVER